MAVKLKLEILSQGELIYLTWDVTVMFYLWCARQANIDTSNYVNRLWLDSFNSFQNDSQIYTQETQVNNK